MSVVQSSARNLCAIQRENKITGIIIIKNNKSNCMYGNNNYLVVNINYKY